MTNFPPVNVEFARARTRWVLLAVLILVHFVLDLFVPACTFIHGRDIAWQIFSAMILGICISQIDLVALWATLAGGPVAVRVPWSLFLITLVWNSLNIGNRVYWENDPLRYGPSQAITLGVVLLSGLAVALLPLWIARNFFRWRLRVGNAVTSPLGERTSQFSIAQLMLGTALFSAALGISRLTMPQGNLISRGDWDQIATITGVTALVNVLTVLPCVWGAFRRADQWPLLAVSWLIYGLLLTGLEIGFFCALFGTPGDGVVRVWAIFSVLNLTQCASVFLTFVLLRTVGFQFVREGRSTAAAPVQATAPVLATVVESNGNAPAIPLISEGRSNVESERSN